MNYIFFTILGFCLGSTLFAYWIPKLLKNIDICELPPDHNPGVANAYTYGGFFPGTLALFCELGKGFLPVFLSRQCLSSDSLLFVPVMAAPVFGHAFPFFRSRKGGKAIAVSFGVMIGLLPTPQPLFYLVLFYLLFSLIIIIHPHAARTVITFSLFTLMVFLTTHVLAVKLGCLVISVIVVVKHLINPHHEPFEIRFLSRHA